MPVVMSWNSTCYINDNETTSTTSEPPNSPGTCTLSTVYGSIRFLPACPRNTIPTSLARKCTCGGRKCPHSGMSCSKCSRAIGPGGNHMDAASFAKLQRFHQPSGDPGAAPCPNGINYDHESVPTIGTWGPAVPTNATTMTWNITANVTAAGEIDVNFIYTAVRTAFPSLQCPAAKRRASGY